MPEAEVYRIADVNQMATPALAVYRDLVEQNIRRMGELMGGFGRLRPHVKTHKMSRVAQLEMAAGITKFKCATPKEAAMLGAVGATDVMIAYPVLGGAIEQVVGLRRQHPQMALTVIADDAASLAHLSAACIDAGVVLGVAIDLNTGMDRTGTLPGRPTLALAKRIVELPGLSFQGLHVYDGHVGDPDPAVRKERADASISTALVVRRDLEQNGYPVRRLVASGSPGFEHTARAEGVDEVSPGTWIFWDFGYGDMMKAPFQWAALVLSRVISRPAEDLMTLDAGSKSISPDVSAPYFRILGYPEDLEFVRRNEEHQVIRLPRKAPRPNVGDVLYLVPRHVCTTVNLWDEACVIDGEGRFVETWAVDARGH